MGVQDSFCASYSMHSSDKNTLATTVYSENIASPSNQVAIALDRCHNYKSTRWTESSSRLPAAGSS